MLFSNKSTLSILFFLLASKPVFTQNIQYSTATAEIINVITANYVKWVNIDSIVNIMVNNYLSDPETIEEIFTQLDPHIK